jgi:hypothetical protein
VVQRWSVCVLLCRSTDLGRMGTYQLERGIESNTLSYVLYFSVFGLTPFTLCVDDTSERKFARPRNADVAARVDTYRGADPTLYSSSRSHQRGLFIQYWDTEDNSISTLQASKCGPQNSTTFRAV